MRDVRPLGPAIAIAGVDAPVEGPVANGELCRLGYDVFRIAVVAVAVGREVWWWLWMGKPLSSFSGWGGDCVA